MTAFGVSLVLKIAHPDLGVQVCMTHNNLAEVHMMKIKFPVTAGTVHLTFDLW